MAPHLDQCDLHENCIVVYVGHTCPVCDEQKNVEALEDQIDELNRDLEEVRVKEARAH